MEAAYRLKFMEIWRACLDAGMSSADARLYSTIELENFYKPAVQEEKEND